MTLWSDALEKAAEALSDMQVNRPPFEWHRQPLGWKERCRREAGAVLMAVVILPDSDLGSVAHYVGFHSDDDGGKVQDVNRIWQKLLERIIEG